MPDGRHLYEPRARNVAGDILEHVGRKQTIALAGDWVAWDILADYEGRNDLAFQGVLATYYGEGVDRVGAYGVYRWQENDLDDTLSAAFFDVFARWGFEDDHGARWYAAARSVFRRSASSPPRSRTA